MKKNFKEESTSSSELTEVMEGVEKILGKGSINVDSKGGSNTDGDQKNLNECPQCESKIDKSDRYCHNCGCNLAYIANLNDIEITDLDLHNYVFDGFIIKEFEILRGVFYSEQKTLRGSDLHEVENVLETMLKPNMTMDRVNELRGLLRTTASIVGYGSKLKSEADEDQYWDFTSVPLDKAFAIFSTRGVGLQTLLMDKYNALNNAINLKLGDYSILKNS